MWFHEMAYEVILLLNILAYEVVHAGWCLMEAATKEGWSLRRFRERVLRAAARVVVSGHRVTMVIGEAFARSWHQLWPRHARITALIKLHRAMVGNELTPDLWQGRILQRLDSQCSIGTVVF